MTGLDLLQFLYIVSNGNREIFADIVNISAAQLEEWLAIKDGSAEIPDTEWLDEFAEIWRREEKEARLLARLTGQKFELNTLGMPEYLVTILEEVRRKHEAKD